MPNILMDEAFVDSDGYLKWCSRPKVAVPLALTPRGLSIHQQAFLVVLNSENGQPFLSAVPLDNRDIMDPPLCQIPDAFFDKSNC